MDREGTSQKQDSIGVAWLEPDGTIKLHLRATADGGITGTGVLSYSPVHAQYKEILEHVGPLKPGERVPVRPWDD